MTKKGETSHFHYMNFKGFKWMYLGVLAEDPIFWVCEDMGIEGKERHQPQLASWNTKERI
jgi:hypothetical protein